VINNYTITLTEKEKQLFKLLSMAAQKANTSAFVVGGFVRDKLLNRECHDIDIVCLGDGIELAEIFAKIIGLKGKVHFFKNFGTAMVNFNEWTLEFVGARKESYHFHSRKPEVEPGTLADDQNRRDFTINAMAISLQPEDFGQLIDPFGGLSHLEQKKLITPLNPEITFSDDPLRMMRAIRFACQLSFEIEPEVFEAIGKQTERIHIVSMERITVELQKIMATDKPSVGFILLYRSGLLAHIFPDLVKLDSKDEIEGISHKNNFFHTLQVLDNLASTSENIWLRWAALLHDIAKPLTKKFDPKEGWTFHGHEVLGAKMVYQIFKHFKLPLDHKMKYVQKLVRLHQRPMTLTREEVTDSAIRRLLFETGDDIDDLMTLCRADITSKNERKVQDFLANYDLVMEKLQQIEEKDRLRNWQPPVDGELIMKTFDISPSKEVGLIKTAIREAILEGQIDNNFEDAYSFMIDFAAKLGLKSK
jgi:poly(A) polymerase